MAGIKKYICHEIELIVPFHDLDPMNIVWHGNYLKYFDMARFALFDSAGIDLTEYFHKEAIIFPVTRSSVKHIQPLRHNDRFTCKASVTEARYKIAMDFEIRLTKNKAVCARGKGEQAAVSIPEMAIEFEIPKTITRALEIG